MVAISTLTYGLDSKVDILRFKVNTTTGKRRAFARRFFCIALLSLSASACADSPIELQTDEPPANVLFVGNSFTYYNNSLHNHYRRLVRASAYQYEEPPVTRILTISGGHLPEHRGGLPAMVAAQDWDVVSMHGHSLGPISEATAEPFREAARDYAEIIREHGARPVFMMTWAYAGKPEMTAALDDAYTSIAKELSAEVIPVGLAFETVTSERPDIVLRIADARHPTVAGTYLAACSFYAALFKKSPEGLNYHAGMDPEDATYLQKVAWDTVTAYDTR